MGWRVCAVAFQVHISVRLCASCSWIFGWSSEHPSRDKQHCGTISVGLWIDWALYKKYQWEWVSVQEIKLQPPTFFLTSPSPVPPPRSIFWPFRTINMNPVRVVIALYLGYFIHPSVYGHKWLKTTKMSFRFVSERTSDGSDRPLRPTPQVYSLDNQTGNIKLSK